MINEQTLELALKFGIPLVLLGYIIIKGMKIAESMAKSLSTMNRELGEIKQVLSEVKIVSWKKKWPK